MSNPMTLSGPSALTQRAAVTLLSMPPDKPTTAPCFRRRLVRVSEIKAVRRAVSLWQSRDNSS